MAAALSANAASAAGKSVAKGFSAAMREWKSVVSTTANSGELSEKIPRALQKIITNPEVKESVSALGGSIVKTTKEAAIASSLIASGLAKQLSSSPKFKEGCLDVTEASSKDE